MRTYLDTGVFLKLYSAERESPVVERWVKARGEAIRLSALHEAEVVSALRLKQFRKEGTAREVEAVMALIEKDFRAGVLRRIALDWPEVWSEARGLAGRWAGQTGCRTLDSLHVASARWLGCRELVTTDERQAAMAAAVRLRVVDGRKMAQDGEERKGD